MKSVKALAILMFVLIGGCASAQSSYFVDRLTASWKTDRILIVLAPLGYESQLIGYVEVPAGFETDLASVPRVFGVYDVFGGRANAPAVIHDYLLQSDSEPVVSLDVANEVFLEAMESIGLSSTVRYPMYWGVCIGAESGYHKTKVGDKKQ